MASTVIRGAQIKDSTVQRHDLDTTTVGQALVTKIVQGSGITLSSTGADSGTGDVTVAASAIPLASSTQSGLLNQTSGLTTDFIDGTNNSQPLQPVIWSVRLRSFNAVGNPTFEVDQRNVGNALINPASATFLQDRWQINKSALTGTVNTALVDASTAPIVIPGTSFGITAKFQRITVGTAQASLAAGDFCFLGQSIEGPRWRELTSDVHSLSLLVRSSVAGLAFSVSLRDSGATHSLVKQCTLGAANTWTLISLPNLPVWSGIFSAAPGQVGYVLAVVLAAGATFSAAASSAWQTANMLGVTGMSNFLATAGATFDLAFVQHEPGALCTTPIDCPFGQNLDGDMGCLRYFAKSYDYEVAPGTVTLVGVGLLMQTTTAAANGYVKFPKNMAKIPVMTAYNYNSGAANSAVLSNGISYAVTGFTNPGKSGFWQVNTATMPTPVIGASLYLHYIADTSW